MPSAAAKIEKPASQEGQDSLKSIVTIFEKKTRNLEKRKGKLELLKKELEQGKELNEDQKAAVGKYDQVQETLELTKELQKSVTAVVQEHLRQTKRQARREQLERQAREAQRVRELLEVQDLLLALGSPAVRQCFLDGEEGAPQLSAETFDQLDQLYKLVCPDREECEPGTFPSLLSQAAEHLVALLDARPRPLLGTTYKALREVLLEVQQSAYFSGTSGEDSTPAAPPSEEDATATEEEEQQPQQEVPLIAEDESPVSEVPEPLVEPPQQQPQLPQPVTTAPSPLREVEPATIPVAPVSAPTTAPPPLLPGDTIVVESAVVVEATPLVPGRLDFFQESQIDLDTPHMDPAVVAALPSVPAMPPPPAAIVQPAGFVLTAGPPPHPATVVPPPPHHAAPPPHQSLASHTIPLPPQTVVQPVQQPVVQQQPPPPQPHPQQPPPHQQPQHQPQLPPLTMDYSELVPIPTVTFTNQSLRNAHGDDRRPRRGGPGGGPPRRGGGYTNGKGPQWQPNGSGHDRPEGYRGPPRQAGSGPRGGQHPGRGRPAGNRGPPRNTGVPAAAYAQ